MDNTPEYPFKLKMSIDISFVAFFKGIVRSKLEVHGFLRSLGIGSLDKDKHLFFLLHNARILSKLVMSVFTKLHPDIRQCQWLTSCRYAWRTIGHGIIGYADTSCTWELEYVLRGVFCILFLLIHYFRLFSIQLRFLSVQQKKKKLEFYRNIIPSRLWALSNHLCVPTIDISFFEKSYHTFTKKIAEVVYISDGICNQAFPWIVKIVHNSKSLYVWHSQHCGKWLGEILWQCRGTHDLRTCEYPRFIIFCFWNNVWKPVTKGTSFLQNTRY